MKFGFQDGKLHIDDFTPLMKLCCAFVEILLTGLMDGEHSIDLIKPGSYYPGSDKKVKYREVCSSFIDTYVNKKVFVDLTRDLSGNGQSVSSSFVFSSQSDSYIKVCNAIADFVDEILSGLSESSIKKNGDSVQMITSHKCDYSTLEKSFDKLYTAIEKMFVCNGKSNKPLVDMVFHELKTHLVMIVISKWSLFKGNLPKKNEMHFDKEATDVVYVNLMLPVILVTPTIRNGLNINHVVLPNSDIGKMEKMEYAWGYKGGVESSNKEWTNILNSSEKWMNWIKENLSKRRLLDKKMDLSLYSQNLRSIVPVVKDVRDNSEK